MFSCRRRRNFPILYSIKQSEFAGRIITKKFIEGNTDTMNIVAPLTFIFNKIKNYHRIQANRKHGESDGH